jgi:hypothetical protein
MRHSILTLTTILLLSGAIWPTIARAQITVLVDSSKNSMAEQLSPFNLAFLSYQGYLEAQGIPSDGSLRDVIASGTVTAQDIMQAAVKANRLSEQTLGDQGYRNNLEVQLKGLTVE